MNWAVGVITCPRVQPTLDATLESLSVAGWKLHPSDVIHDREMDGCYRNWRHCAEWLLSDDTADLFMVCEDDILVSKNLREYLERTHLPDGVLSLYCGYINHHDEPGWHQVTRLPKYCHGALATVWTRKLLEGFMAWDRSAEFANSTDILMGRWCRNTKTPYWCHSPSFVKHTGYTSTLGPGWDEANTILRNCKVWCEDVSGLCH